MINYYELKTEITNMLKIVGIPIDEFKVAPGPIQSEGYFYKTIGNSYILAYFDRGITDVLCKTDDVNEFKYQILKNIIVKCAIDYEVKNRVWYQDSRRIWMAAALSWMQKINNHYFEKLINDFNIILRKIPFNDTNSIRLYAIKAFYDIVKRIDVRFPYNIKNFRVKKSLESIKNDIKKSIHSKVECEDSYIIEMADRISVLYDNIQKSNIPLNNTLENSLQVALEKVYYLNGLTNPEAEFNISSVNRSNII